MSIAILENIFMSVRPIRIQTISCCNARYWTLTLCYIRYLDGSG